MDFSYVEIKERELIYRRGCCWEKIVAAYVAEDTLVPCAIFPWILKYITVRTT